MFERILVPLDGSELSEKSLPVAQAAAKAFGATVYLVRVIEDEDRANPEIGRGTHMYVPPAQVRQNLATARQLNERQVETLGTYLQDVAFKFDSEGIAVRHELLEGDAEQSIAEYARDNQISLIVMSSHRNSWLDRLLNRSVTGEVMRSVDIPVLVVPA